MSGGSYDYVYGRLQDVAESIPVNANPRRAAFKKLMMLVSQAMHDIEWVDSCDYGPGDEDEAIDKCFAFLKGDEEMIAKAAAFDELAKWFRKKKI